MPRVILCTWRGFLPKHFPPDHLQGDICPCTLFAGTFLGYFDKMRFPIPELLVQVEFEDASIFWLEQMSATVEQVLFQNARP